MTNRIPLIVNAGAAQIQELSTSDNLLMPGTDIVGANTINTSNVIASANITASYFLGNGAFLTGISSGGNSTYTDANVTTLLASGNVTSNVVTTANISGDYILGNGSQLTGISANYGNSNVAAYLPTYTGNIAANVISTTGNITTDGFFVGNFVGNISGNLVVPGSNTQVLYNNNGNAGASSALTFNFDSNVLASTGNISTTGNIISVGVYTSGVVSATGNVLGGNLNTVGSVSAVGNIIGGNLTIGKISAGNISATGVSVASLLINVANNAANALQALGSGIAVGPVGSEYARFTYDNTPAQWVSNVSLDVQGNINAAGSINTPTGNIGAVNITASGNINGNNISGNTVYSTGNVEVLGNVNIASAVNAVTVGGSLTTNAQPNITSVGTLTTLSVFGNINSTGNASVLGNVTATILNIGGIVNTNANGSGNIGSSTTYFNTVFAKSTSAQYADLAEVYVGDTTYAPGTVLSFGGTAEVTQSNVDLDVTIAGVVSTNPAYIMNTATVDPNMVVVALTGRVPCFVVGAVSKGAMMVSAGNGYARAEKNPVIGSVIGKALQSFDGDFGTIEIVVGRL